MNSYIPNTTIPIEVTEDNPNNYVIEEGVLKGVNVELLTVQPLLLNKVLRSVKKPKRPMYATTTITGATQMHPMDEESAKETPHGMAEWEYYKEQLEEADSEQNERMTTAIFAMGTRYIIPISCAGWEETHRELGIDIPDQERLKNAHFLATSLIVREITAITQKIMKLAGVDEATVKEAEENFRNSVHDRSEPTGQLVDFRRSESEIGREQLALQSSL